MREASLQSQKPEVSGPLAQTAHSAAVLRRDAVHRAEDGDCLEAAENPPELIPGGKLITTGSVHTQRPQRSYQNYGTWDCGPFIKRCQHFVGIAEKVFVISAASVSPAQRQSKLTLA